MRKEIENHIKHLEVTMERLFTTLYSDDELNLIYQEEGHLCENLSMKKSWIKVSKLVVPGVGTGWEDVWKIKSYKLPVIK